MKKHRNAKDRTSQQAQGSTNKLALTESVLVEALVMLLERGFVLRVDDGSITIWDEKEQRRKPLKSERNRRAYQKLKASIKRLKDD